MTRSPQRRRRIDAAGPLERLTSEQRADMFLRRLSHDISAACRRFWRDRGMTSPGRWRDAPASTQDASTAGPGGGSKSKTETFPTPSGVPFPHARRFEGKSPH